MQAQTLAKLQAEMGALVRSSRIAERPQKWRSHVEQPRLTPAGFETPRELRLDLSHGDGSPRGQVNDRSTASRVECPELVVVTTAK